MTGLRGAPGDPSLEAELTARGRTLTIHSVGRTSGQPRQATVGFIEDADGSLIVAAGEPTSHWARNLMAEPRCRVDLAGAVLSCRALPIEGRDANAAVAALILKYGTPAERLGGGPVFRLVPTAPSA